MSSYPGELFSDDDLYMMDSNLTVLSTTNHIFNNSLSITPQSLVRRIHVLPTFVLCVPMHQVPGVLRCAPQASILDYLIESWLQASAGLRFSIRASAPAHMRRNTQEYCKVQSYIFLLLGSPLLVIIHAPVVNAAIMHNLL